jgi:voltage-dependent potassium channel beta subunit
MSGNIRAMRYRRLGRYGVKVSEVGLGSWLTLGRTVNQSETDAIVGRAYDSGVNFFDTADAYHRGEGETALGNALKGKRRETLFLATKCFWPMSDSPNDQGLSRKHIFESVHNSLARLGVEYLDLFQFHRHDPNTPVDESVRAVDDLIRQGKVLYWGVSEWTAAQIVEACQTARNLGCHPPVSDQPQYNLLVRGIEREILPICSREGLGALAFSPLAQGVLTGKYRQGQPPPAGSRGADRESSAFMAKFLAEPVLERVAAVGKIASDAGVSLAQFALAWCLRRAEVSSVIVGATSPKQLDETLKAAEVEIHPSEFAKAEAVIGESLN